MEIIKGIVLVIAGIIVLALIAALFVSKDYSIKREITIRKPSQEVYDFVKFVKNQEQYSKWVMMDPAMHKETKGTDGTVGFVYAWDSPMKEVGKGEEEIAELVDGRKVRLQIRFIKPFESTAFTEMNTEALPGGETKVLWEMMGTSKYPMNLMNLFMDGILGKDLEKSLHTLKGVLEK